MGNILENVRKNVEKADELEQKGIEQGEKDAAEVKEIKSTIEGMDKSVDSDIIASMEDTKEAAKSEGAGHMESVVHSTLEEGYSAGNEAISEGTDQAGRSEQAAQTFETIAGSSEFGRSTAEASSQKAEEMASAFQESAETAKEGIDKSEDRYKNLMDEIRG